MQRTVTNAGSPVWAAINTRMRRRRFLPDLDRMIDAQAQEFDEAKRKALFLDIERRLARDVDVIPLIAHPGYFVSQPYVHGWVDYFALNTNDVDWAQTWYEQSAPKGR